jgi:hypothetical protein
MNKSEFEEFSENINTWWKKCNEKRRYDLKTIEDNQSHLRKKALELKKPVPPLLQVLAMQPVLYLSQEQMTEFNEWFEPLISEEKKKAWYDSK